MLLLDLIKEFCRRTALSVPTSIFSSQDDQLLQLAGLSNEVLDDLVTRFRWQELSSEAVWVSAGTENQGVLTTLAPGYDSMVPDTFFNRTTQLAYTEALTAPQWQGLKASGSTVNRYFRLIKGNLHIVAPPAVGDTLAFEYYDSRAVLDANNVAKTYFTADDDTSLLPSRALLAGLRWRWKKEKGFPYAEEFADYERIVSELAARNKNSKVLNSGGECRAPRPGIMIPDSNWTP